MTSIGRRRWAERPTRFRVSVKEGFDDLPRCRDEGCRHVAGVQLRSRRCREEQFDIFADGLRKRGKILAGHAALHDDGVEKCCRFRVDLTWLRQNASLCLFARIQLSDRGFERCAVF